jgi:pyruvate formate lyase activating enzyme
MSAAELLAEVNRDRDFHIFSKGGLTLSGGEPLMQPRLVHEVLEGAYSQSIDTVIETCGHVPWAVFQNLLHLVGTIIYDIKHVDNEKHQKGTGVGNRLIIENLHRLSRSRIPLVARLPLIPGFNTDWKNMNDTVQLLRKIENIVEIHMMPFHQLAKEKYRRIFRSYPYEDVLPLESSPEGLEQIRNLRSFFQSFGFNVFLGGG